MRRARRNRSAKFIANAAWAAMEGTATLVELAQRLDVHPNQITEWRRQLVAMAADAFASESERRYELDRINAALDAMRPISDTCAKLAAIADSPLAHHTLQIFIEDSVAVDRAYAPQGGGSSGPYSWAVIGQEWIDVAWSHAHLDSNRADLQEIIAHEMDHLNNAQPPHLPGTLCLRCLPAELREGKHCGVTRSKHP